MADASVGMLRAALGTLVVTAIGTLFLAWQVWLTRKAVEATSKATETMERQNELAEDTAKRQLRAYVTFENAFLNALTMNGKISIGFELRNSGQTPAYEVELSSRYDITDEGVDAFRVIYRNNLPEIDTPARTLIAPGGVKSQSNVYDISIAQFEQIFNNRGKTRLIVSGISSYRDVFGKRHLSTFRYFLDPSSMPDDRGFMLAVCHTGNSGN